MTFFSTIFIQKLLYQVIVVILGIILARNVNRIEDRSLSAACLFVFLFFTLFLQALGQNPREAQFSFTFFFYIFHTAALYFLVSGLLRSIGFQTQARHLFLICIILGGQINLKYISPLLGAPAEAVQTINTLIFYQLLLIASLGIYLCAKQDKFLLNVIQLAKTPLIYAAILGLLLVKFSDSLTYNFLEAVDSLRDVTDPLALLIFGVIIGRYIYFFEVKEYTGMIPGIFLCVIFKLLISPALATLIVILMGIDQPILQRGLILSAGAPTGIFAAILVSYYGTSQDKRFALVCVLFTSILSLLTIPGLLWILNRWFPIV